jgi:hypothetical protein
LNEVAASAPAQGPAIDGDAVHANAVERRIVPLGANVLAQDTADTVRYRAQLGGKACQMPIDTLVSFLRSNERAYRSRAGK